MGLLVIQGIQYTSILLLLYMTGYIPKRWNSRFHGWVFVYSVSTLLNNTGYLALMNAKTLHEAMLVTQITFFGRIWIPYSLLMLTVTLCKRNSKSIILTILAIFHVASYILVIAMEHVHLFYASYTFVEEGFFPHLVLKNGVWHYVFDFLILCYGVYCFTVLISTMRASKNPRRRKSLIFVTAAIFTDLIFYILQVVNIIPGYDVTDLGFTIACIFFYIAIFAYDILETKEIAQDYVIERISEGVIATNEDGSISFYNKKARNLLPVLSTEPDVAIAMLDKLILDEQVLSFDGKKYTPKENVLMDKNHVAGKVYILTDDTRHYQYAEKLTREMMIALSKAVDAKDHYTNGHSERVAWYARELARRLGKSEAEQEQIYEMGLLHDIGKIGVSEDIINKPAHLSTDEFESIKTHTLTGWKILHEISAMPELASGARWHHERFDGTGYPDGLKGDKIPEAARIICVADCYDAMTSTRTYSKPKIQEIVRAELERCAGTQFDPVIADVMIQMIDEDKDFLMNENLLLS